MEPTQGLTEPAQPGSRTRDGGCPACGAPGPGSPPVEIALFGGAVFRRCTRCGSRRVAATPAAEPLPTLLDGFSSLPRLDGEELVEPMAEGPMGGPLPESGLAEASETEIRHALAGSWRFVAGPRSAEYLDRLARSTARTLEDCPEGCCVLLVDDPVVRRLALPSGRLLFSVGALRAIEDEAELVFVLGHELAHVASGDAARRLVALGMVELARGEGGGDSAAWLRTADDMLGLGYGLESEHRADLQGVRAVLALGYDPESVIRYLERLGRAVDDDDLRVAETTLAHPLPADRLRRVQKSWGVHVRDPGASRVNRDVFRRAVGHSALVAELQSAAPFAAEEPVRPLDWRSGCRDWRLVGVGVAILVLAGLFLVLGLMLAR